jgi:predicted nucleotidyltransferase
VKHAKQGSAPTASELSPNNERPVDNQPKKTELSCESSWKTLRPPGASDESSTVAPGSTVEKEHIGIGPSYPSLDIPKWVESNLLQDSSASGELQTAGFPNLNPVDRPFSSNGLVEELYNMSRSRPGHFEGAQVLPAILATRAALEETAGNRADANVHEKRISEMIERAKKILRKESFVEGIFYFGSAMRGKENCNDIDMMLVLRHSKTWNMIGKMGLTEFVESDFSVKDLLLGMAKVPLLYACAIPAFLENTRANRLARGMRDSKLGEPIAGIELDLKARTFRTPDTHHWDSPSPLGLTELLMEGGPALCVLRSAENEQVSAFYSVGVPEFFLSPPDKVSATSVFGKCQPLEL